MIDGIPNRPLYFYQKDMIETNHLGSSWATLIIVKQKCLLQFHDPYDSSLEVHFQWTVRGYNSTIVKLGPISPQTWGLKCHGYRSITVDHGYKWIENHSYRAYIKLYPNLWGFHHNIYIFIHLITINNRVFSGPHILTNMGLNSSHTVVVSQCPLIS